jgi:hypothetical protein
MTLYPIHIHELPRETLYVRVTHPDGTAWAIPTSEVIRCAARYYEREGWDEDAPEDQQPRGEELIGILWANPDTCQWANKERWSEFAKSAVLLAGPGTIPDDDDRLWWFEEAGGEVKEMTTLDLEGQLKSHGRLLAIDDIAIDALIEDGQII